MAEPGSSCFPRHLNASDKRTEQEIQEVTASLAKKISINVAVVDVLFKLIGIFKIRG